jgi:adenosylcobinamide kinase/adenosylcobinamide-phosphate guanylyltransferase
VPLTLVLGGARSGKSQFAQQLAGRYTQVVYVATAVATDAEMAERIAIHRSSRPAGWSTLEAPSGAARAIAASPSAEVFLLDCLTVLIGNLLGAHPLSEPVARAEEIAAATAAVEGEVEALLALVPTHRLIIVANEVGLGVVPAYPAGRLFRDLAGWANQRLAAAAEAVWLLVAGLPLRLK